MWCILRLSRVKHQVVQTQVDNAKAESLLARVDRLRDQFQTKVTACKDELQEPRFENVMNDQLDKEKTARQEESPSKKMKTK